MQNRPPFDNLPLRKGDPPFSAWHLYGENDQLGTLNLLTPENTLAAKDEIRTGIRVALDPPLNVMRPPFSGRKGFTQKIIPLGPGILGPHRSAHDDAIEFNTQVGAQWDGFRHVTYHKTGRFYNDTSCDDISGERQDLGIHSWVEHGSIVGRGVLLDFFAYSQHINKHYDLINGDYAITHEDLQECAKYQGTEIRYGDLLFVRAGFWIGYHRLTDAEKKDLALTEYKDSKSVGVEATRNMAKWLWDSGIVACAGDSPAWERAPSWNWPTEAGLETLTLHEIMLGGWGMPIGELFDLEKLSEECKRQNRWTFFVTSVPLHVPGGVASPPNCIAIF